MPFPWFGWAIAHGIPMTLIAFTFGVLLAPDIVRGLRHIADESASAVAPPSKDEEGTIEFGKYY